MGISSVIISKVVASPRLGRTADIFGGVMSKLTSGRYKTGLSRKAYQLSGMVSEGDVLSVKNNKLFLNGSSVLRDDIFRKIERNNIQVTKAMRTPEGMASSLRWDIIGNAPEMCYSLSSMASISISSIIFAVVLSTGPLTDLSADKLIAAINMVPFLPFHKLITLFIGTGDSEYKLTNVEGLKARVIPISKKCPLKAYINGKDFINKTIHIKNPVLSGTKPAWRGPMEAHEKAHLLGASEYSAYRITLEKFVKGLIYERKNILDRIGYIFANKYWAAWLLFNTIFHNIYAVQYAIDNKNPWQYFSQLRYYSEV